MATKVILFYATMRPFCCEGVEKGRDYGAIVIDARRISMTEQASAKRRGMRPALGVKSFGCK